MASYVEQCSDLALLLKECSIKVHFKMATGKAESPASWISKVHWRHSAGTQILTTLLNYVPVPKKLAWCSNFTACRGSSGGHFFSMVLKWCSLPHKRVIRRECALPRLLAQPAQDDLKAFCQNPK